ncbi:MAG TPA: hypothetical protein VF603_08150 [Allosphingosinicella sp.]
MSESGLTGSGLPEKGDPVQAAADHVAMAKALLIQSAVRRDMFKGLFRQPAWDMLLTAYVALHEGVELTETAICAYSGEPAATARRWLRRMEQDGLVRHRRVAGDVTTVLVAITKGAAVRLQQLLENLISEARREGRGTVTADRRPVRETGESPTDPQSGKLPN